MNRKRWDGPVGARLVNVEALLLAGTAEGPWLVGACRLRWHGFSMAKQARWRSCLPRTVTVGQGGWSGGAGGGARPEPQPPGPRQIQPLEFAGESVCREQRVILLYF